MKTRMLLLVMAAGMMGCGGIEEGDGAPELELDAAQSGLLPAVRPSAAAFWTEAWRTPLPENPLTNRDLCIMGRLQPMLAGGFVVDLDHHLRGLYGAQHRVCDVEASRAIVVPLVTVSMDGAQRDVKPPESALAGRVRRMVDSAHDLRLTLDGKDARLPLVRTGVEIYGYSLAEGGPYDLGPGVHVVAPAAADGIFAVLPRLTRGTHQLVISGMAAGQPFRTEYLLKAH